MLNTLRHLRSQDPDGWYREPTPADYAAFEREAKALYGEAVWEAYQGNWDM